MARVTIEDVIDKVRDRFELVVLASRRAAELNRGATSDLKRDMIDNKYKEKDVIIALREIASGLLDIDKLREDTMTDSKNLTSNVHPGVRRDNDFHSVTSDSNDMEDHSFIGEENVIYKDESNEEK